MLKSVSAPRGAGHISYGYQYCDVIITLILDIKVQAYINEK